jgi:hypothetical protein
MLQSTLNTPGSTSGYEIKLSGLTQELTYSRKYNVGPFDIRQCIGEIAARWSADCKKMGEEYHNHQWNIEWRGTTFTRNGFFRVLHTLDGDDKYLNCFAYALGTFNSSLEQVAHKKMSEIQKSVSERIDHIVTAYFTSVEKPEEGDLVLYSIPPGKIFHRTNGDRFIGTTHAGIYRQEGHPDGTVESKWGWLGQPYVFQHEFFFTPDFYGKIVQIYRLKSADA